MEMKTLKQIVEKCTAATIGSGDRKAAIGFFSTGTAVYDRLVKSVALPEGCEVVGVLVGERLTPHPEALSVSGGVMLSSTERCKVETRHAVIARRTGEPVAYARLFAAGTACDKVVQMLGVGSAK